MSGPANIAIERSPHMSMSQVTSSIDLREFRENGVVSAKEHDRSNSVLLEKLQGMRVPVIRKGFELEPYTYDEYIATAGEDYDKEHAPISDPEVGVDLNCISMMYRAKFSMSMFRSFEREWFSNLQFSNISFADVAVTVSDAGYSVAPTSQFRSLLLAGLQIEEEIRERYKKSLLARDIGPTIAVETRFFVPLNLDLADTEQMMVTIQIDLIPEE